MEICVQVCLLVQSRAAGQRLVQMHTKVPGILVLLLQCVWGVGWENAYSVAGPGEDSKWMLDTFLDCSPVCLFTEAGMHVEPRTHWFWAVWLTSLPQAFTISTSWVLGLQGPPNKLDILWVLVSKPQSSALNNKYPLGHLPTHIIILFSRQIISSSQNFMPALTQTYINLFFCTLLWVILLFQQLFLL